MRYAQQYSCFFILCVLNVTMQLVCDVTAGRLIPIGDYVVSVTVLYFPVTYILSDLMTEVYGYRAARQALLYTLGASVLAGLDLSIGPDYPRRAGLCRTG